MDDNSFVKSFFAEDIVRRSSPLELSTPTDLTFQPEDSDFFDEYPLIDDDDVKHEGENHDLFEPLDPLLSTPVLQKADLAFFSFPSSPAFEVRGPQPAYYHNHYNSMIHTLPPNYHASSVPHPPPPATTHHRSSSTMQQPAIYPSAMMPPLYKPPPPVLPLMRSYSHPMKPAPVPITTTKIPVQRSATVPTTARELDDVANSFKSKGKRCTTAGCTRRAQSNNRCKAHGGGARCQFQGCPKSSQGGGYCRAHGGGKKCEFEGCTKGQQRKGFCYAHGGIRKCKHAHCDKKDRGNGYCIAHGGGKRCSVDDCVNAVRKGRFCRVHMPDDG
ncbi:hypothetical protein SPRG_02067 [Saprolegnia parasitica CBS 223.65]|uniref:WRKY19-like zinc finger domain-containing protein n=1 Tax=Saprolegnia parasitica (strain CBS 223.65) TaxID=695850 RepID=A0A067CRZ7_SAPPC|nr:hypothetical protein SPRG_02067 [Saprolegnia parasitica CBS 223.65]KDO33258.1 hypothetical protein SPRG_02067 [Saprolegnia parasitica CBS 223.65]|eukprot:XP_012196014.1 hypothetical protein SPRG_02067 [Saprolegnia parasitica CBS 223.65]